MGPNSRRRSKLIPDMLLRLKKQRPLHEKIDTNFPTLLIPRLAIYQQKN